MLHGNLSNPDNIFIKVKIAKLILNLNTFNNYSFRICLQFSKFNCKFKLNKKSFITKRINKKYYDPSFSRTSWKNIFFIKCFHLICYNAHHKL